VEQPPDEDDTCNDDQAERLIPAKRPALHFSPFVFGDLLIVRLDAGFNHAARAGVLRTSIGCRQLSIELLDGTLCNDGLTSRRPIADDCLSGFL
jgi:hypothetical protein